LSLVGTYYSFKNSLKAILMLNNKGGESLEVTPTFFSLDGTSVQLSPIVLNAASYQEIDIKTLLANSGQNFKEGNLQVSYQGKKMQLGAQVKLIDANKKQIWEEQFYEATAKAVSSQLEGVWWLPSNNCETKFIITNTTDASVTATIKVDGTNPAQNNPKVIQLNPHETKVLDIIKDLVGKQSGHLRETGGISISHTGSAGAILARMLISRPNKGYSATMSFADPNMTESSQWYGVGLRVGKIDDQKLEQVLAVRNTGNQNANISGKISYTNNNGNVVSISIPSVSVPANSSKEIKLDKLIKDANLPSSVEFVGVEMDYDTPKGSVVMSLLSLSKDEEYVFQVPMYDPTKTPSSAGGYPWKANGDYVTLLFLKNDTESVQKHIISLSYTGGAYTLGVQEIKPQQNIAIDFRALRDAQTPDSMGNLIPQNIERGQMAWSVIGDTNHILNGRSEQFSLSEGIASTYDCRNCCPDSYFGSWMNPGNVVGNIGGITNFAAIQQDTNCYGQMYPPHNADFVSWQSTEQSVASSDPFTGETTALAVGEANIQSDWTADSWMEDIHGFMCEYIPVPVAENAPFEVAPKIDSISPSRGEVGETYHITITGTGFVQNQTDIVDEDSIFLSITNLSVTSTQIEADVQISFGAEDGNHPIKVTARGILSNAVQFYAQAPTKMIFFDVTGAPNGVGPLQTPVNGNVVRLNGSIAGSNQTGVYRNYSLVLTDGQGVRILQEYHIYENFSNNQGTGPLPPEFDGIIPAGKPVNDLHNYTVNSPNTLAYNENDVFDQTFTIKIGGILEWELSTKFKVEVGSFNGVLKSEKTLITP
jgi:hypothetical protein